jgi:hypothetical protein
MRFKFFSMYVSIDVIVHTLFALAINATAVLGAEDNVVFQISDEVQISTQDMDCDYSLEDYARLSFDFEYPKIMVKDNESIIVTFIDTKLNNIVFMNVLESGNKIIARLPAFEKNRFERWPIIISKGNNLYLATKKEITTTDGLQFHIQLFLLNERDNKLDVKSSIFLREKALLPQLKLDKDTRLYISGIIPLEISLNRFMAVGGYVESHFHPLALISGHLASFEKNFSVSLNNGKIGDAAIIEKKGWFEARNRIYAATDTRIGTAYSAWIRNTSRPGFSDKHNEMVCYSKSKGESKWTEPSEVYSVIDTKTLDRIRGLSMAAANESLYMIWRDLEKGIYVSEIDNRNRNETTQIADVTPSSACLDGIEPLYGASTEKLAVDQQGNIFILWIDNFECQYKVTLKARINGQWSQPVAIKSGQGVVKLPDIKVDKRGVIHIAYVKKMGKDKFGCYYVKVEKKEKVIAK